MPQAICNPLVCPTSSVVLVPGSAGANGSDGSAGANSYSLVQSPGFVVPAISSSVSFTVDNNAWMVIGQNVYVFSAGYFQVNSLSGTTIVGLTYLNYADNTAAGNTVAAGSQISPAGTQAALTYLATVSGSASGANANITSLTGLTTPLSAAQGGTGVASLALLLAAFPIQSGYAVLSSGTKSIGTANITTNSVIVASTFTAAGTRTAFAGYVVTKSNGTPGTFTITAISDAGGDATTLSSCTDTVAWIIIG